jgi:hypothetical protein
LITEVLNADPATRERLSVVFFPDFNVKNAQPICPAADLSEQISTAGKEASGTGNMKFMMNGALTIGTLDGANVEMLEEVGKDNFFLFGLTAEEVEGVKREGYRPAKRIEGNDELREVLELVARGHFSRGDREMFRPLLDDLRQADRTSCWPTLPITSAARKRSAPPGGIPSGGPVCRFSTRRAPALFPPTARSATTAKRYGRWRRSGSRYAETARSQSDRTQRGRAFWGDRSSPASLAIGCGWAARTNLK